MKRLIWTATFIYMLTVGKLIISGFMPHYAESSLAWVFIAVMSIWLAKLVSGDGS